jgi:uncharacterized protein
LTKNKVRVTISIDGPKEINDALRVTEDGEGTYNEIEKGIATLHSAGGTPHAFEATYTSLHKSMGYSRSDIEKFLKTTFADVPVMVETCVENSSSKNYSIANDSEIPFSDIKESESLGLYELKLYEKIIAPKFSDFSCSAGLASMAITPEGFIYPCHFFFRENTLSLGNISDDFTNSNSFAETTLIMQNARRSDSSLCKNCWAIELCSVCPAQLLLYGSNEQQSHCNSVRSSLSNKLLSISKKIKEGTFSEYINNLVSHAGLSTLS